MRAISLGLALCVLAQPAWPIDDLRPVGNWLVGRQADRFGDKNVTFAMRSAALWIFALKCEGKQMLFVVTATGTQMMAKGEVYAVKFRVDNGPVITTQAAAVDDKMLAIFPDKSMLVGITLGKEAAFRFDNKTDEFDVIVPLDGAARAMHPVFAACR